MTRHTIDDLGITFQTQSVREAGTRAANNSTLLTNMFEPEKQFGINLPLLDTCSQSTAVLHIFSSNQFPEFLCVTGLMDQSHSAESYRIPSVVDPWCRRSYVYDVCIDNKGKCTW